MINLLVGILFGGLSGWIASLLTPDDGSRTVMAQGTIGVIGALFGAILVQTIAGIVDADFNISTLMVSLAGAIVLLFGFKTLYRQ